MRDLVFVATVVAFFGIAVAYVAACGLIVGRVQPGEVAEGEADTAADAAVDAVTR